MTIKERVLTSAKTSFAKYGFKKDELSSLVDIISANLTDESTDEQISAAISSAEGYARMMQSVYNRGVSETTEKFKGWIPKPAEPEPKPTPTEPKPNGSQTISLDDIQKLIKEGIEKGLQPYKEEAEARKLKGLLLGHEKLKGIPKMFAERYSISKEEDLDSVAAKIESDYTALKQELVKGGQFVPAPQAPSPQQETDDFIEAMKGFAERNKSQS